MKKLFNIISVAALAAMSAGCFADLDQSPIDSDTPYNYFKDSTECMAALVGCYDALNRYNENLFNGAQDSQFVNWNITDEMYNNAAGTGPKVYSYTSGYAANQSMYRQLYVAIERCNQFLKYLPQASMTEEARDMMEGEARFIRAFCYFDLVENWGRVPLVTEATASVNNPYMKQSDEDVIYDWIISEMTAAEGLVKPITYFGFGGRINKSAVRAVLARVCLFKAGFPCYDETKYEEAYYWAKQVIDDPAHSLIPNYADVFIPLVQDRYDIRENLWEIESYFNSTTDGRTEYMPSLSVTLGTNCSSAVTNVSLMVNSTIYATKRMFSYYEQDPEAYLGSPDERRNWNIAPYTNAPGTIDGAQRLVLKYHNYKPFAASPSNDKVLYDRQINKFNRQYATIWPAFQSNTGTNLCIVRYADVLLMAAEALCMSSASLPQEAIDYVNLVRKRAYGVLDGRKFIDRIEVVNPGSGYVMDKVAVEVTDPVDNTSSVTCVTSNTEAVQAYRVGDVKGPLTIATATVGTEADEGKIVGIELRDRGHAYAGVPTVTIRNLSGTESGEGAQAVAVMRTEDFDYELPAEATSSKEAFMNAIMEERARELCFEGWRRLDLKRWHNLVEMLQATRDDGRNAVGVSGAQLEYILTPGNNVSDAHYYLPIPANELMLNRELVQNEGW
ncbi:MAG TPA: RagB/SusD family nutrient uptake outer membrane protein [Candidatus Alistipes intestinipullorum]|nr:RagB/SusD family nutrient uptake outer membrane protein [Candidatus Alistipes intestinipullorum]